MSKALGESKGWRSTSDWASWPWVGWEDGSGRQVRWTSKVLMKNVPS